MQLSQGNFHFLGGILGQLAQSTHPASPQGRSPQSLSNLVLGLSRSLCVSAPQVSVTHPGLPQPRALPVSSFLARVKALLTISKMTWPSESQSFQVMSLGSPGQARVGEAALRPAVLSLGTPPVPWVEGRMPHSRTATLVLQAACALGWLEQISLDRPPGGGPGPGQPLILLAPASRILGALSGQPLSSSPSPVGRGQTVLL